MILLEKTNINRFSNEVSLSNSTTQLKDDLKKIYIAGIGPGNKGYIIPYVNKLVEYCDVIIGSKRNMECFDCKQFEYKEIVFIDSNLDYICELLKHNAPMKNILILASGDPCIFGIMEYFKKKLSNQQYNIEVIPGISSLQYLCAKLMISLHNIKITSMHGRQNDNIEDIIKNNTYTAIFTDSNSRPDKICSMLLEKGLSEKDILVYVGENLSYENEKIVCGTLHDISKMRFENLTLMIVYNQGVALNNYSVDNNTKQMREQRNICGIPDGKFVRGKVPMTKEEIRVLSISKLRLKHNSIIYDVGAGTGSISVECALISSNGKVYAIEKDPEAIELICKNADKFGAYNLHVIKGEAPEAFRNLPLPDRIFIGGTDGNLQKIIKSIADKFNHSKGICSYVRVVLNAITIETAYEALKCFENCGFKNIEIINVSISRGIKAGDKHMMKAGNPVYIISAEKGEEEF